MGSFRNRSAIVGATAALVLVVGCTASVQGEATAPTDGAPAGTSSSPPPSSESSESSSPEVAAALPESETITPDDEVVLVARAGIDRSTDGGQTWERVDVDGEPHTLATDGTTVLALSTTYDDTGGPPTGVVLSSPDAGSTWSVAVDEGPVFEQIAHGPDGFVAVGQPEGQFMIDGPLELLVGTSADGTEWATTTVPVTVGGDGYATLTDLTWNGTAFSITLVSGMDESLPLTEVLTSPDALSWTAGPLWQPGLAAASTAWTGQGWGWVGHVLDGYTYDTDFVPHTRPLTGSSSDGTAWTAAALASTDVYLDSLTCTGSGWLALSVPWWDQDQALPPQLRHSTDLTTWQQQGTSLPVVQSQFPGYASGTDLLVLGSEPDPATCGSTVTAPVDQFALVPPTTTGTAPDPGATAGTGGAIEGDGWCEVSDSTGKAVLLASNITIMPGYPPSALFCDHMVMVWEDHLTGAGEYLDCTLGPVDWIGAGSLAGFVATCPVSAKFALYVAEQGTPAAQALKDLFAEYSGVGGGGGGAPVPDTGGGAGTDELGIGVAMTLPPCDGSVAVIVGSAVDPADYAADVQGFLNAYPGASYVRTDLSCPSFRPSQNGNAIYAVFYLHPPGTGCEAVYAQGGDANGRIMQDSTPDAARLNC